jgi:uncharacterized protein involved in outer membrane biogenesis
MLGIQIAKQAYSFETINNTLPALLISLNMAPKLIKIVVLLITLSIAAVVAALLAINPNDYKPLIETKAQDTVGLTIKIDGDIGWSLFPLGFSVDGFDIYDQQGQLFTHANSLQLAIDTLSLLRLEPKIEGVYASGAHIVLTRNSEGAANWDNLFPSSETPKSERLSQPSNDSSNSSPHTDKHAPVIFVPAQHVHFQDISVEYQDALSGNDTLISNLDLEISNASAGTPFPLELSYEFSSKKLALNFEHQLSTRIQISKDLSTIHLLELINNLDASGAFASNRAVKLSLTGDVELRSEKSQLVAHNIQLSGAGLAIDTNFTLDMSREYPEVTGDLSIAPFALSSIDRYLSLDLGVNNKAFQSVTFKTPFALKNNLLSLPTFDLQLDQSQFIGRLTYHLLNKDIDLSVKGDSFVLDNYLAAIPSSDTQLAAAQSRPHSGTSQRTVLGAVNSPASSSKASPALLPLDTLRSINAIISLSQDSFEYSGVRYKDLKLETQFTGQSMEFETIDFSVFDGQVQSKASIALTENPHWKFDGQLRNLDLKQALESQMANLPFQPSGRLNGNYQLSASGNSVSELMTNNSGSISLNIAKGVLGNINLDEFMCQGVALINKDQLTTDWQADTNFQSLTAKNTLFNGKLNTTSLNVETGSLQAFGNGAMSLSAGDFAYQLSIKPKSFENESACRINKKLASLEVPINCSGSISDQSSEPACQIDNTRMTEQLAHLAIEETNRKVEKELDRGFEKELGKYIDKDSELGKQLKKSILGIFN